MTVKSKKHIIGLNKDKFLQILKDKYRPPAEFVLYHPFMKKKCEWITGKIENNFFSLTDYRFSKFAVSFLGKIIVVDDHIEVPIFIKFRYSFIIAQSLFLLLFVVMFFISDNFYSRISILLMIVIGETANYFLIASVIKAFNVFFENLFVK